MENGEQCPGRRNQTIPSEQYGENYDSGAQGNTPYAPTKEVIDIMQICGEGGSGHDIHSECDT